MSHPITPVRRLALGATAVALAGVGALGASQPASAADDGGWIRLTHLSPDTPDVNVALTSVSDSRAVIKLSGVGYGDISDYAKVPAGQYVATMTPPGGDAKSTPAVSQPVTVKNGRAYTVAAMGKNADLEGKVLADDLKPAVEGKAKVRVLQASISAPAVDVQAEGGPQIADGAKFSAATGYTAVDAGAWKVAITPTSGSAKAVQKTLKLKSASVSTVILLDNKSGGVTAKVVTDAGGMDSGTMPKKGVKTGEGGLVEPAAPSALGWALLAGAIGVVGWTVASRRPVGRRG